MNYETLDYYYEDHFTMQVFFRNELLLPQITDRFYAMILFNGCSIYVKSDCEKVWCESGLLILSPAHGISEIKVLDKKANCSVQTLIFSPFGINTNFTKFPDSFEYRILNDTSEGYNYIQLDSRQLGIFLDNYERIDLILNRAQSNHWPCIVRSYILELIILLSRNVYIEKAEKTTPSMVNKILEYFQYSYSKRITLDELARMFATNRTSLNSLFNEVFGISAIAYLNKIRIQNATLLLSNTSIPLCDIAEKTGFSDESYFSKAFKKSTGKSPREFRLSLPHPHGNQWEDFSLSNSSCASWKA